jgi:transposase
VGLHPDTVARAAGTERFNGVGKRRSRQSLVDPYIDFIRQTLAQRPRLTGTRVHEMIVGRGYTGSVVQLRRRIRDLDLRRKPKAEAFFRLRPLPAEQGQVDWGYLGTVRVGSTTRKLWLFVMVLSWSWAHHVYFSFEQNAAAVARGGGPDPGS